MFVENAKMPSGADHEIKIEPNESSSQETVEKNQESVKELQETTQGSTRYCTVTIYNNISSANFYFYMLICFLCTTYKNIVKNIYSS